MKQRILVLGAHGFIGREVVAALASSDWATPVSGVRRAVSASAPFEQRVLDATQEDSVLSAAQGAAAIVNCVAGSNSNLVSSTRAACAAAARMTPAPRIIHISSMSVYGSATGIIDEAAPLLGDLGDYSAAKIQAESVAAAYGRCIILRPGCVFGPRSDQWTVRMARLLQARRLGDLGAAGDGYCNLVHVADVANAILRGLQRAELDGRAFNLSTPQPPTWNEFLARFALALGAVPVRRISHRRLRFESKVVAPPLKIAEILAGRAKINTQHLPPPIPPSLLRVMGQEIRLDTRRSESDLGMRWRDLDASLAESAQWFLKTYAAR